jgi:hypothetical protein
LAPYNTFLVFLFIRTMLAYFFPKINTPLIFSLMQTYSTAIHVSHLPTPRQSPLLPMELPLPIPWNTVALPEHFNILCSQSQISPMSFNKLAYLCIPPPLFMHSPTDRHLHLIKRILPYIKGTIHYGLHIAQSNSMDLFVYSDADWAGCLDTHSSTVWLLCISPWEFDFLVFQKAAHRVKI